MFKRSILQGSKMIKSADCSPLLKIKHNYRPTGIKSDEPQRRAPISMEEVTDPDLQPVFNMKQATEVDQFETKLSKPTLQETAGASSAAKATNAGVGVRMVLVRDIGIQVSGNSPNLNLYRRFFKKPSQVSHQQQLQPIHSGTPASFGSNNSRKLQAHHGNVRCNTGVSTGRGSTSVYMSETSSSTQLMENQPMAARSSSTAEPESRIVNPSATSALSKPPVDNKKEPTKNFPPEILF